MDRRRHSGIVPASLDSPLAGNDPMVRHNRYRPQTLRNLRSPAIGELGGTGPSEAEMRQRGNRREQRRSWESSSRGHAPDDKINILRMSREFGKGHKNEPWGTAMEMARRNRWAWVV